MDVVNLIVTIISIICTIISIAYAVKANRAAERSEDIKSKLQSTLNTITLKEFVDAYNYAKQLFLRETRNSDWFKGKDPNMVIAAFDEVLSRYTCLDSHICDKTLKEKLRTLKGDIQFYDKLSTKTKKEVIRLSEIIAEDLGVLLNKHLQRL